MELVRGAKYRFKNQDDLPDLMYIGNHFHWDMPRVIKYKAIEE